MRFCYFGDVTFEEDHVPQNGADKTRSGHGLWMTFRARFPISNFFYDLHFYQNLIRWCILS